MNERFARTEHEVHVERVVNMVRLVIVGAVVGATVMSLIAFSTPLQPKSQYNVWQILAFSALIGAGIGMAIGGIIGIILQLFVKRKRGTALAVQEVASASDGAELFDWEETGVSDAAPIYKDDVRPARGSDRR